MPSCPELQLHSARHRRQEIASNSLFYRGEAAARDITQSPSGCEASKVTPLKVCHQPVLRFADQVIQWTLIYNVLVRNNDQIGQSQSQRSTDWCIAY